MPQLERIEKEVGPVSGRKRRRLRAEHVAVLAAPVQRAAQIARVREVLRVIRRVLVFGLQFLEYPELVRLRGPGLQPEERYEFEDLRAKEGARRVGWF